MMIASGGIMVSVQATIDFKEITMIDKLLEEMVSESREYTMTDDETFSSIMGLIQTGDIRTARKLFSQAVEGKPEEQDRGVDDAGVNIEIGGNNDKPLWERQMDNEVKGYVLESQAVDVTGLKFILAEDSEQALSKAQTAGVPYEVWGTMNDLHSQLGEEGQIDFTTAQHDFYKDNGEE